MKISNQEIKDKIMGVLTEMINRKHLLREAIATKSSQNSNDIAYMYKMTINIQQQIDKYIMWIRNSFLAEKGQILQEFEDIQIT